MKQLLLIFFCISNTLYSQVAPSIQWKKSLGGSEKDIGYSIEETNDGEFILAGYTRSTNGDISGSSGGHEFWIVKLDLSGNFVWKKCFGGGDDEEAYSIHQTIDGGYIIAGYSNSNNGNVSGNHGQDDYWIVKLNPSGDMEWEKSFGGMNTDVARSIKQTTDGGYIVAGYSNSVDGDVTGNHGDFDFWVLRLDAEGNLLWQKSLGGSDNDDAFSVEAVNDGGFIVVGFTRSFDGDISVNHGEEDYWCVKLDAAGNLEWQKALGGTHSDIAYSVQQTSDGGFIFGGSSYSNDGDVTAIDGGSYWTLKLDANGIIMWQKLLPGDGYQGEIRQTTDNGFVLCGVGGGTHGGNDYLVSRTDANGNLLWQESFGGSTYDGAHSVQQTSDGGYIVLGESNSDDGQVFGSHGARDYWVVKLAGDETAVSSPSVNSLDLFPNPIRDFLFANQVTPMFEAIISIQNLQGQQLNLPYSQHSISRIQLNTQNLSPGFYTIQIIDKKTGESQAGKFVKAE